MRIEEYCWAAEGEIGFRGGHLAGASLSVALLVLLLRVKVSMVVPQTPKVQFVCGRSVSVWELVWIELGVGEMREKKVVFSETRVTIRLISQPEFQRRSVGLGGGEKAHYPSESNVLDHK